MDAHADLAAGTVATAPVPAASGTSLVLTTGQGTWLPATPFYATLGPAATQLTKGNSEIVRVTTVATDTLTMTRNVGGTNRSVLSGDQCIAGLYAANLVDIENYLTQNVTGVLDFGSPGEDGYAEVTITCAWASTSDYYTAEIYGVTTEHEDPGDAMVEGIRAMVSVISAGASVTVAAVAPNGTWGTYNVRVRRV